MNGVPVHGVVAATLRRLGIGTVFGVLGDANMLVVADFVTYGGRYVGAVDERGAVHMADVHARMSGAVGVATVTHGPGITNALTSVVEAARARTPLVIVTGDTPGVPGHLQRIDIGAFAAPAGARVRRILAADQTAATVAAAVQEAASIRGPVLLDMPADLHREVVATGAPVRGPLVPQAVRPDEDALDAALGVIAAARRPIVLAGRGADRSGARAALLELAEVLGAPVATTLLGRDLFRGDPFDLGVLGTVAHDLTTEIAATADCVIAFGAGLNRHTTAHGSLSEGRAVIQVDVDAARLGADTPVTAGVVGDATAVARAMTALLREAGHRPARFRSAELRERLAAFDPRAGYTDVSTGETIDVRTAMIALDAAVPADRTLVTDVGRYVLAPWRYVHVEDPLRFTHTGSFGSIGLGVAGAVGAAVADLTRTTLGIVGDGGGMMGLVEFGTAVRNGAPLVLAVVNDGCYGAEWDRLADYGVDPKLSLIPWPDFTDVASALGGHGLTVRKEADFAAVSDHIRQGRLPLLVDIRIDPAVRIGDLR
ncbi:thiamine pyrophosphate-binding protein [Pseudonocardia thermophila]|uniref:thiamine pyrophosphate-binding protein n=1 Tax=Pseudonocardia thermophila TaxID=1848 RepID=UPI00248D71F6|nr:thiamine pyrophosphate-binding protein [Pseudonocardia thermophila]